MSDFSDALSVTAGGLRSQATRLRVLSENIANTDTPGYHRKLVRFEEVLRDAPAGVLGPGRVELDQTELQRIYDPSHPMADASGHYNGSNVNLILEIADAREASRSYEANLKMFDQIRRMSSGLMDLLRR